MPLAPGTALQDGHYVIDALLESAPNGDLYWGTHVSTGTAVYLQVLPSSPTQDDPHALLTRLQGLAFAPRPPLPKPLQAFLDEGCVYLAMGTGIGQPWSLACRDRALSKPKAALSFVRHVAEAARSLHRQGITTVDLSANRVWVLPGIDSVTLTGFVHGLQESPDAAQSAVPKSLVQGISALLYSALSGQIPNLTEPDQALQGLQAQRPDLSPHILNALREGFAATIPQEDDWAAVDRWLAQLPDSPLRDRAPIAAENATTAIVHHPRPVATAHKSRQPYLALVLTAVVAAVAGVASGAAFRMNPNSLPGNIRLNPDQNFPALNNWSGSNPRVDFKAPYVPQRDVNRSAWQEAPWDMPRVENQWTPPEPEPDLWVEPIAPEPEAIAPIAPEPEVLGRESAPLRPSVEPAPIAPTPARPTPGGNLAPVTPIDPTPAPTPAPEPTEVAPFPTPREEAPSDRS